LFYSRKRNHENIEKFPRAIFQSIIQATGGLRVLLDAAHNYTNLDIILKLQASLEEFK